MEKFKTTAELWDVSPLPRHSAAPTVQHMANALFFTVKTIKAIEKVCRDGEPATKRGNYGKSRSKEGRHFQSSEKVRPTSRAPQD